MKLRNALCSNGQSNIRHKDFVCLLVLRPLCVTLSGPPLLDSETGLTGELWSKTNLLKWQK